MYYSLSFSYKKPTNLRLEYNRTSAMYPTGKELGWNKNTWLDWHLVPTERPSIAPPEVITKTVEIPGMGDLDLTESLTGYPAYKNRTGSITFMVQNDYESWHDIYQKMCSYLHGRKLYMSYEEDPRYYYYGRFTVDAYESGDNNSQITINYDLEPFKYDYNDGKCDGGYWDSFDFDVDDRSGVLYSGKFYNINVNSDEYVDICKDNEWGNFTDKPIIPEFEVANLPFGGFITIKFINKELGITVEKNITTNGKHRFPEIILTELENHGKVAIGFDVTSISGGDETDKPNPITFDDMYNRATNELVLQAKGHGLLNINIDPGRM